jgi:D-3-phosphoglycerate dehydrogenase
VGALVVLTDQVFPDTELERELLADIGAELRILQDPSPEAVRAGAREADALLTTYAPIDSETIAGLERCRIIARYGIGVDNIDLEAARERGIVITNVPDYCIEEVADHTLALLLAAARKIVLGNDLVRAGRWGIEGLVPVRRLRGRTLGLIGFGRIGSAVASRARAFGMEVCSYDPYVDPERIEAAGVRSVSSLDELLPGADAVSVHAPLTDSTRGLVGERELARMRPDAILINTSRGPIVSTAAVVEALRAGRLGAACLDVFDAEPPDAAALQGVPNLIATPHGAFYSEESIRESQSKAALAIVDVLSGREPAYRVA